MTGTTFAWTALVAGCSVLALVAATFAIGARTGRHSVMDVAWGASIAVAGVASFLASAGHGAPARRWLLLVAAFTWGYRLAWHVAVRARGAGSNVVEGLHHQSIPPLRDDLCGGGRAQDLAQRRVDQGLQAVAGGGLVAQGAIELQRIGDAVAEAVADAGFAVHRLAVREIARSGKPDELLDRYGISAKHIIEVVERS